MNKSFLVTSVFLFIVLEFLMPGIVYATTQQGDTSSFAGMTSQLNNMKAFATGTLLPFGGVIGAVYGAIRSYMTSSPWPFITFGATAIAATLGPSLIDTATWISIIPHQQIKPVKAR